MAKSVPQMIAENIAKKHGMTIRKAEEIVNTIFDVVDDGLEKDKLVKVKGLGTFKVQSVKARESINVNTGERVLISGHDKVNFTPDAAMKDLVNKPFADFETVVLNDGVVFEDIEDTNTSSNLLSEDNTQLEVETKTIVETPILAENQSIEVVEEQAEIKSESQEIAAQTEQEKPEKEDQKGVEAMPLANDKADVEAEIDEKHTIVAPQETANYHRLEEDSVKEETEKDQSLNTLVNVTQEQTEKNEQQQDEVEIPIAPQSTALKTTTTRKSVYLPLILAVFLILLIGGIYFYGEYFVNRNQQTIAQKEELNKDEKQPSLPDEQRADRSSAPISANDKDTAASTKQTSELPKDTNAVSSNPYIALSDNPKIRYGAYHIVGIEKTIVLKKGETMASYSRKTLGADMIGYFQVLNGVEQMQAGDTLKVPKVELRPEYRNK